MKTKTGQRFEIPPLKLRSRDGLVRKVALTVEIKLRFQISSLWSGRCLCNRETFDSDALFAKTLNICLMRLCEEIYISYSQF